MALLPGGHREIGGVERVSVSNPRLNRLLSVKCLLLSSMFSRVGILFALSYLTR